MKDILAAIVLGDGYLERHGSGVRLQIIHSKRYFDYVEWKRAKLEKFKPSKTHYCQAKYPFWRFVTRIDPLFKELHDLFYVNGVKHVPKKIDQLMTTPESLAVYFMDDGTCDKEAGTLRFETQSYNLESIENIQQCLKVNFSIQTQIHKSGVGRGLRLYVNRIEALKLRKLIESHLVKSMQYKLPCPCNDLSVRMDSPSNERIIIRQPPHHSGVKI